MIVIFISINSKHYILTNHLTDVQSIFMMGDFKIVTQFTVPKLNLRKRKFSLAKKHFYSGWVLWCVCVLLSFNIFLCCCVWGVRYSGE